MTQHKAQNAILSPPHGGGLHPLGRGAKPMPPHSSLLQPTFITAANSPRCRVNMRRVNDSAPVRAALGVAAAPSDTARSARLCVAPPRLCSPSKRGAQSTERTTKSALCGKIQTGRAICLTITSVYGIIKSVTRKYQGGCQTNDTTKRDTKQAATTALDALDEIASRNTVGSSTTYARRRQRAHTCRARI